MIEILVIKIILFDLRIIKITSIMLFCIKFKNKLCPVIVIVILVCMCVNINLYGNGRPS